MIKGKPLEEVMALFEEHGFTKETERLAEAKGVNKAMLTAYIGNGWVSVSVARDGNIFFSDVSVSIAYLKQTLKKVQAEFINGEIFHGLDY